MGSPETTVFPEPERGVCLHQGVTCYICEQPVGERETVVLYRDERFWEQSFAYHGSCWANADLAAKKYGGESIIEGRAFILPAGRCAGCGDPIGDGSMVVRVAAGGRRRVTLILHARCYDIRRPS